MDSGVKMNYFTRQWWFFDSCQGDFDNDAHFEKYFSYVDKLAETGVPVLGELRNPCSTHDYQVTRILIDKESFSFVLRDPEHWKPFILRFNKPTSIVCTNHDNGEEHASFDLSALIGSGIGYAEYQELDTDRYQYSIIFDHDFTVVVELESEIVFKSISSAEAEDHEVPITE